ncbi:MAG: GPO family capsid scaffolding protein [Sphingomonas sp.]|nr:GPO family capsid scaffolding protein [Sphingomonas sp.]
MPKVSKFFRVAVEGATADGRTIERQQLLDMAATYNRETYAARVNMEHIRGITADPPFRALGDVIALKAEEITLDVAGTPEKKLALFAQIEPTEDLLKINAAKQKLFSSVEINPNFAASGKAYLMGLAVTDSPASLGTEMLQFVAGQREKGVDPYAARRSAPNTLFTAAQESAIEFEEVASLPGDSASKGFFEAAGTFFKNLVAQQGQQPATPAPSPAPTPAAPPAPAQPSNDNDARFAAIAAGMEQIVKGVGAMGQEFTAAIGGIKAELATVKASIETTEAPGQQFRTPASGGTGQLLADC